MKLATPALETQRLLLRKFTGDDIGALYAIFGDEEANTYLPWFPLETLAQAERLYEEKYVKAYGLFCGYHYAVCLKEDSIPIGYIDVSEDAAHDLGYGLRKEFWGRGIVTEACKAVMDQAQKDGFSYITATHDVKNIRSGKVMQRLGMRYQYSYGEQWQPKNIFVTFRMYQYNFDPQDVFVYQGYWEKSSVRYIETGAQLPRPV